MSQQPGNVEAKVVGTIPFKAVSEDCADWPLIVWQGTKLLGGAWKVTWSKVDVLDHLQDLFNGIIAELVLQANPE